jgi:deoxyribonuclease-4
MKLGAHVTISKGLIAIAEKAKKIGADCLQIFASPPRNWNPPKWSREEYEQLKEKLDSFDIKPRFLHSIYLVNLHTEKSKTLQKAIDSVVAYQNVAETIGALGTIIHSHRPNATFKLAIDEILARSPATALLIIEHSAINTIEDTLALFHTTPEVPRFDHLGGGRRSDRLGLCLDTCHLFAAGYDVREPKVIDEILRKIDAAIGLENLVIIHLNDAKSKLGSHRDIHENIGEGSIGKEAFGLWLNHPKLKSVPFIIETPGFDDKGPDKKNLDILKSLIK